MRCIAPAVALLIACSAPAPAPERIAAPEPVAAPACPTCPVCTPERPCPECPTCPTKPEPVARDWQCVDYVLSNNEPLTTCYVSESACRRRIVYAREQKMIRKAGQCTARPTAFCMHLIDEGAMHRQIRCYGSFKDCDSTRELILEKASEGDYVSTCREVLNTDPFDTIDELPSAHPTP